jgi:hypothetical protein
MDKLNFLKTEFPKLLQSLSADAKGNWGVLNGIQMVEHMSYSVHFATGLIGTVVMTPVERLEASKSLSPIQKIR